MLQPAILFEYQCHIGSLERQQHLALGLALAPCRLSDIDAWYITKRERERERKGVRGIDVCVASANRHLLIYYHVGAAFAACQGRPYIRPSRPRRFCTSALFAGP